ncbi:hypothetical protein Spb1_02270 [Planctopirus ephydatiae]|uniref:Uncharacterized protein n=1 Tax=Planctopirus ephydatiae TaxID=2528019 RepID=A0A518GIE4_9PLAN|nr:hypothetical protein Spb1_02270 [Planctopirus ephydatiae]
MMVVEPDVTNFDPYRMDWQRQNVETLCFVLMH